MKHPNDFPNPAGNTPQAFTVEQIFSIVDQSAVQYIVTARGGYLKNGVSGFPDRRVYSQYRKRKLFRHFGSLSLPQKSDREPRWRYRRWSAPPGHRPDLRACQSGEEPAGQQKVH